MYSANSTRLAVFKSLVFFGAVLAVSACVPKTQFEDQQDQLKEAKAKVREMEEEVKVCDPDLFLQLKEQAQSLDILTQELVDRNTELASEVSRLRAYETQVKSGNLSCEQKVEAVSADYEGRLSRTRQTYEDLVSELNSKVKALESENAALRRSAVKTKPKKAPPKPKPTPQKKN